MSKYHIPPFKLSELLRATGMPITTQGSAMYTKCPFGGHETPEGHLRIYETGKKGSQHGGFICTCGAGGSAWEFLSQHFGLPPIGSPDFDETILFICDKLDIEPEIKDGAEFSDYDLARRIYRDLDEALEPIRLPDNNPHWVYNQEEGWVYRGLRPMLWKSRGVGIITRQALEEIVNRYGRETLEDVAGLSHWKGGIGFDWLTEGVAIIFKDKYGGPVGIGVRRYAELTSFGGELRTKYVKNKNHPAMQPGKYLFGTGPARRAVGLDGRKCFVGAAPVIYLVEGELDCLAMQLRGIPNVVTHGSGIPTDDQMEEVLDYGADPVMICDKDQSNAGFKNALSMAEKWPQLRFVMLPAGPNDEDQDPESYLRTHTADQLRGLTQFTSTEIMMYGEQDWHLYPEALAEKYLSYMASVSSAYDEQTVRTMAELAQLDERLLRSQLVQIRNQQALERLRQTDRPIQIVET